MVPYRQNRNRLIHYGKKRSQGLTHLRLENKLLEVLRDVEKKRRDVETGSIWNN